jgi:hypothetical protein
MYTKITIKNNDQKISWEIPEEDPTIEQFIIGMSSCLLGLTFDRDQIKNAMRKFIDDEIY